MCPLLGVRTVPRTTHPTPGHVGICTVKCLIHLLTIVEHQVQSTYRYALNFKLYKVRYIKPIRTATLRFTVQQMRKTGLGYQNTEKTRKNSNRMYRNSWFVTTRLFASLYWSHTVQCIQVWAKNTSKTVCANWLEGNLHEKLSKFKCSCQLGIRTRPITVAYHSRLGVAWWGGCKNYGIAQQLQVLIESYATIRKLLEFHRIKPEHGTEHCVRLIKVDQKTIKTK